MRKILIAVFVLLLGACAQVEVRISGPVPPAIAARIANAVTERARAACEAQGGVKYEERSASVSLWTRPPETWREAKDLEGRREFYTDVSARTVCVGAPARIPR